MATTKSNVALNMENDQSQVNSGYDYQIKQTKTDINNPERNPDFRTIKMVSQIVLFVLRKCWMMCSTGLFLTFVAYWIYGSFLALCLFVFGLAGLFYQISDWLLYHPNEPQHSRIYVPMPSLMGLSSENTHVKTSDNVKLHAVFIKQNSSFVNQVPTILFLHGNAGNIGHRLAFVQGLYNICRCNILLVEYRGYGHSEGSPSEEGFYLDAQAGLRYLLTLNYIDKNKIVIFGRSLGGAVAIDLVARPEYRKQVLALIVENTFTSIPDMGRKIFNFALIRWLPTWAYKNKFNSASKMSKVKIPALFISGLSDKLIPPSMVERLTELCGSEVKRLQKFLVGSHNDTWRCNGYYQSITMFLDDVMLMKPNVSQGPGEIY